MMLEGRYDYRAADAIRAGYEIAGVVDAVGSGVENFTVGQRVAALTLHGGFAEYIVRDADTSSDSGRRFRRPGGGIYPELRHAWQMIHRVAKLPRGPDRPGDGSAGGVGTAVLQLLRLAGVKTYGAASRAKHDAIARWVRRRSTTVKTARSPGAFVRTDGVDVVFRCRRRIECDTQRQVVAYRRAS